MHLDHALLWVQCFININKFVPKTLICLPKFADEGIQVSYIFTDFLIYSINYCTMRKLLKSLTVVIYFLFLFLVLFFTIYFELLCTKLIFLSTTILEFFFLPCSILYPDFLSKTEIVTTVIFS